MRSGALQMCSPAPAAAPGWERPPPGECARPAAPAPPHSCLAASAPPIGPSSHRSHRCPPPCSQTSSAQCSRDWVPFRKPVWSISSYSAGQQLAMAGLSCLLCLDQLWACTAQHSAAYHGTKLTCSGHMSCKKPMLIIEVKQVTQGLLFPRQHKFQSCHCAVLCSAAGWHVFMM
jgi:hypothetical protein